MTREGLIRDITSLIIKNDIHQVPTNFRRFGKEHRCLYSFGFDEQTFDLIVSSWVIKGCDMGFREEKAKDMDIFTLGSILSLLKFESNKIN